MDFDGDTCAVVPNDTPHGKIIVDGIRNIPYDVWEAGQSAVKVEFTMKNFINHLVNSAKVDRTGIITNHASRALDISNHLRSAVYFAKQMGCSNIELKAPADYKGLQDTGILGSDVKPKAIPNDDGTKTFVMKGLLEAIYDKRKGTVRFVEDGYVGTYSFEEILEIADKHLGLVEILRVLQGREIDGAKTGVYAEGVDGNDFTEQVKVKITPHHMITRLDVLKRDVSQNALHNEYISLSPMGRIHDYMTLKEASIMDFFNIGGSDKIALLESLLTEEEASVFYGSCVYEGETISLLEFFVNKKKAYGTKAWNISQNLSGDEARDAQSFLKEKELEDILAVCEVLGLPLTVASVLCYKATYQKDDSQSEGLSYGWLLADVLLSVFSRGNKKFELFRLPSFVETASIKDGFMYVNGNKYMPMNAPDSDALLIHAIQDKPYALVHKKAEMTVKRKAILNVGSEYVIGTFGFKHYLEGTDLVESWKSIVKANGFVFDVLLDNTNRAVISVNGKTISGLMAGGVEYGLINKKVKITNNPSSEPMEFHDASIKNIKVTVIGEA